MNAIITKNISKKYNSQDVVNNLNITVPKGSIYGFIGKNGAGKSTTQKMICGLIQPTSGAIEILGHPVTDDEVRHKVGALIEQVGMYPKMSAFSNVLMQAFNLGLDNPTESSLSALKMVNLEEVQNKKAKHLSLGMKQRLGLAIALLGDPELLILDEPINGLDPEGIVSFRNVLEELHEQGVTIFISSHILGELSKVATHYGFINDGQLLEELTAEELLAKRKSYLSVKVSNADNALNLLKQELNITKYELVSDHEFKIYDTEDTATVNYILSKNDFKVEEVFVYHEDLEDYFIKLVGGAKND
ncbi:ABC transporter ATP-binding protein [Leuconostoc sp. JNUCC 76]